VRQWGRTNVALKLQVPRKAFLSRVLLSRAGLVFLGLGGMLFLTGTGAFAYYYMKYSRMIEEKLSGGPFTNTSKIFAAPRLVAVGDELDTGEVVDQLRRSGYSERKENRMGWYNVRADALEIFPGPDSYFDDEPGVLKFQGKKLSQIISLRDHTARTQYQLEPELITNLFDKNREKRRIVRFKEIPRVVVNAVISAEDKRFFQHAGFDPIRIVRAAWVDLKERRHAQGASTLSMQVARMFWLTPEKTWSRKFAETLVTIQLEQKLTKEEIFEFYVNQVPLGRRGSFNIHGVAEASQAYLGKPLANLNLAEAATIAGLIQRPSFTNPVRWPERAKARRNIILTMMRENGYISDREYAEAAKSELTVSNGTGESTDAPYFVDLVNDFLQDDKFNGHDFQASIYRIFTTLDLNLQREATEAVRLGMKEVDALIAKKFRVKKGQAPPEAQVALVAMDPATGEVKALVGGRNYGESQLNRALAKRQPGSAFKPFVYAAALNTAVEENQGKVFTPASLVVDEATTFWFDGKPYEPGNYGHDFYGPVTLRLALAKSMNIPAVKLAEQVGYEAVVDLAQKSGMSLDVKPTPAVALGAYEVTPIEIAGAYTGFANKGQYSKPLWVRVIRDQAGKVIHEGKIERKQMLDPRVAYLTVSLLEEVMRSGTAAGSRSRGFVLPAAGKTGTSRDGWFAGFTSKLVCVVYVGFDDGAELKLEGAQTALPVWTEFMKRAHGYREYRAARAFPAPDGITTVEVDPATGQLAAAACPARKPEVFVTGTQPLEMCRTHGGGGRTQVAASWDAPEETEPKVVAQSRAPRPEAEPRTVRRRARPAGPEAPKPAPAPAAAPEEKRGILGKIRDIFR